MGGREGLALTHYPWLTIYPWTYPQIQVEMGGGEMVSQNVIQRTSRLVMAVDIFQHHLPMTIPGQIPACGDPEEGEGVAEQQHLFPD